MKTTDPPPGSSVGRQAGSKPASQPARERECGSKQAKLYYCSLYVSVKDTVWLELGPASAQSQRTTDCHSVQSPTQDRITWLEYDLARPSDCYVTTPFCCLSSDVMSRTRPAPLLFLSILLCCCQYSALSVLINPILASATRKAT